MAKTDALPLGEEGEGEGGGTATPAQPSIEDIAKATAGVLAKQLGGQLQQINTRLEKLETPPSNDDAGGDGGEGGENLTPQQREFAKFYTNPGEYIRSHFNEASDESVRPLLKPMLEDKYRALQGTVQQEFDAEFGEGSFEDIISEDLNTVLESMPENLRVSEEHYRMAVNGLKGRRFNELLERKGEAVAKAKEEEQAGASLLGDSRPRPAGNPKALDVEEKEFIAKYALHTGEIVDDKAYLRDKFAGIDEDSFPVEETKND